MSEILKWNTMTKPITPLVGTDTFVVNNNNKVCLIRRSDNKLWALPGGCMELGETPAQAAVREFREETGLKIELTKLLGVFSSVNYEYTTYPYKDDEFCHLLFMGRVIGGNEQTSIETTEIGWFSINELVDISDGHFKRIKFGFSCLKRKNWTPHFE